MWSPVIWALCLYIAFHIYVMCPSGVHTYHLRASPHQRCTIHQSILRAPKLINKHVKKCIDEEKSIRCYELERLKIFSDFLFFVCLLYRCISCTAFDWVRKCATETIAAELVGSVTERHCFFPHVTRNTLSPDNHFILISSSFFRMSYCVITSDNFFSNFLILLLSFFVLLSYVLFYRSIVLLIFIGLFGEKDFI